MYIKERKKGEHTRVMVWVVGELLAMLESLIDESASQVEVKEHQKAPMDSFVSI